jgi:hypothetical protein
MQDPKKIFTTKIVRTMASSINDSLRLRTELGSVNFYDLQRSLGTCGEKSHAARLGGHSFNPITHKPESVLPHVRNPEHFIQKDGSHNSMNPLMSAGLP